MPPKRTVTSSSTVPNDAKGKAPTVDHGQHSDDALSIDRSRDQSSKTTGIHRASHVMNTNLLPALFVTPAPQPRTRPSEVLAEIKVAQAAKRARTATLPHKQHTEPPLPSIEDVEDQGEGRARQSAHRSQHTVNRQPGNVTQYRSNVVSNQTDVASGPIDTNPPQGSKSAQGGKL